MIDFDFFFMPVPSIVSRELSFKVLIFFFSLFVHTLLLSSYEGKKNNPLLPLPYGYANRKKFAFLLVERGSLTLVKKLGWDLNPRLSL